MGHRGHNSSRVAMEPLTSPRPRRFATAHTQRLPRKHTHTIICNAALLRATIQRCPTFPPPGATASPPRAMTTTWRRPLDNSGSTRAHQPRFPEVEKMQDSGTRVEAGEKRSSIEDRPLRAGSGNAGRGCATCAGHALGYFPRTTLTERVVEFLERYNPSLYGVG